jgi:M6 family metalloprotease-like protein
MSKTLVAISGAFFVILASACSGSGNSTSNQSAVETTTTTTLPTLSTTFTDTPFNALAGAQNCQITDLPPDANGMVRSNLVGFPRPQVIPSPKILVLPFSFSDGEPPKNYLGPTLVALNSAAHFYEQISWGKASFTFDAAPDQLWIRVPKTASEMGFSKDSPRPQSGLVSPFDVLKFASPELNFDNYDVVHLVGSPDLMDWATAWMEFDPRNAPIVTPAGTVSRASLITHNHNDASLVAHELGHAWLNLWDLYSGQNGITDFIGLNRFDVMYNAGLNDYNATDMTIWNKYLAGWVEPEQIRCVVNAGTTTHFISTNSERSDLPKAVMVKISETKVLVIDTWRKSEFNRCCNETIAYVIDATRINFAGPYRLQGSLKNPGDQLVLDESLLATTTEWTLRPDEPLAISNVAITLLDSDVSGALVEVTTK